MIIPEYVQQLAVVSSKRIILNLYCLCVVPKASVGWIFFGSSSKSNSSPDNSLSTSKLSLSIPRNVFNLLVHLGEPKSGHSKRSFFGNFCLHVDV
jgi:hypothetical protein